MNPLTIDQLLDNDTLTPGQKNSNLAFVLN